MQKNDVIKKSCFFFLFLSIFSCQNEAEPLEANVFNIQTQAQWITDQRQLPTNDSLFYIERPAPHFRKEINVDYAIKEARLYLTAAGYYHASINGKKVGKNILDPAWTDFSKRIYYTEYDVTSLLKKGSNCLGIILGNGFYNPLPLRKWGRRNLRTDTHVGKPVFLAKLIINYKNGKSTQMVSNTTWKYTYGPIIKNSVYLGSVYDTGKELGSWDNPGYDDKDWKPSIQGKAPGGKLQKSFFPPVQINQEITPVRIYSPDPGLWIVDMSVNFTGTYKIKLSGNIGDTVTMRFGERVYSDGSLNPMTSVIGQIKKKGVGGPGAPEIAWQTDRYIIGEKEDPWYSPDFTYHTYRYIEITGQDKKPEPSDVKGLFLHSNVANESSFSCSSPLLNDIQKAVERTFLANLVSVQSDCAAREKFGYGGDLNATCESFIYNFDMQSFYRKTIYDWVDAMNDSTFVDTAPYVGIQYCGISWESAFLITQYYLYLYYNDTQIIDEMYALNNKWMEKASRIHPDGLVEKGLSDHESLKPVPVQLTGTAHYLQCARIMKIFAQVLKKKEDQIKYEKLERELQNLIKTEFWDQAIKEDINRQTLFSTLLYYDIIPEDEIETAKDSLLKAIQNGPSGHFNTGIFGTKYVLETLSQFVSPQKVFDIVNSTTFPGWGHMIDQGATTIWETWKESDNVYSNCHPMFGTVTEWYYRWLGGIRPAPEHPGFKEFVLAPFTPEGLDSVNSMYQSPYGQIISNWKKEASGAYRFEMKIPKGSKAQVNLSLTPSQKIEIKRSQGDKKIKKVKGLQSGQFSLGEGGYIITIS